MTAAEMARKRWAGISPEARSAHMKAIARKPRLNAKGKTKMTIEFSTSEFEMAHGKRPSGRGSWAFELERGAEPFWHNGLYSEAKAAVRKYLKANAPKGAYIVVKVLS